MQTKTILIGVLALVFGISAAVGAYLFIQNPSQAPKAETISVVVAAEDINRGQTLVPTHVAQRDWPKDAVPEGVITELSKAIDRTARIALIKGDLLSEAKLAPLGSGRGMASVIPHGMRAVTIQTPNVASGVAGFILPGNKVDVLLTVSSSGPNDPTGGGSTITLLQNVEVLAVDQRIDAPQDNKMDPKELRSVTLLVKPADAARLDLGQNKGTLQLALRNRADTEISADEPATLTGLRIGSSDPVVVNSEPSGTSKPAARPARSPMLIRTMRGSAHGSITLPPSGNDPDETPTATETPPNRGKPVTPSEVIVPDVNPNAVLVKPPTR